MLQIDCKREIFVISNSWTNMLQIDCNTRFAIKNRSGWDIRSFDNLMLIQCTQKIRKHFAADLCAPKSALLWLSKRRNHYVRYAMIMPLKRHNFGKPSRTASYRTKVNTLGKHSVSDPGCLYRIRDPDFSIQDPGSRAKKIPDLGYGPASKNLSTFNPQNCI